MITSRDVVFEETKGWNWEEDQFHADSELTWNDDDEVWEESEDGNGDEGELDDDAEQPAEVTEEAQVEQPEEVTEEAQDEQSVEVRERRKTRPPQYLNDYVTGNEVDDEEDVVNMVEINTSDPSTFEEAVKILKWKEAMDEEMNSIVKNQTWELSKLPE